MNKKFEYVDDNPGSYFGMLVESFEDKKKLNEDIEDNKLTYDSQLDFIKWYKESTGRDDAFYFDDVDCVDEYNNANIPSVYCTGRLTWAEARDRLIKYFNRQDRSLVDSDEAKQFLKDFKYFCEKCKCIDLSSTKQPKMIQNDKYTKEYGAYFKYPNDETIQLFTGRDLDDSWYRKYTATFNNKVLSEKYLDDLIAKIKKLLFKNSGNKLQISNINSDEQLYKLALYLNMISTDEEEYGFQSLYSRPAMSYSNSFKYGDIFKKDSKLARTLNSIADGKINAAFTYKDDPNIILVAMPKFNFLATKDMIDGLNESLIEDKFVPQDKMSKKAQKELNDKKRGTWGNTNPVTRVQPNKKAYDRKRDKKVVNELLSDSDYKNGERFTIKANKIDGLEFDEDPNMAENVLNAIGDISFNLDHLVNNGSESATYVVPSARDIKDSIKNDRDFNYFFKTGQLEFVENESLKESKKLNESSDGWDESKLYDLSEILDEIYNLQYEVQNTVRGAYTNAHTYEELGYYVHNLGSNLMDVGDEIMEMEEEDEEDED